MNLFDQLMNQAQGLDLNALGARVGLTPDQVAQGARALLPQIADPNVDNQAATEAAAATTGIGAGQLQDLVTNLVQQAGQSGAAGGALQSIVAGLGGGAGGAGGQGSLLGGLASALDRDGDGNPLDDLLGMVNRPAQPPQT